MKLRYTVSGTAASGNPYRIGGKLECAPGDFSLAVHTAMREAFDKLTQGRAVFGQPGLGCQGPYTIDRFVIEKET